MSRAQATVEFAIVAPMVALCALVLVAVTVACLHLLTLHDAARVAARVASVADDPCTAARRSLPDGTGMSCRTDDARGIVTVTVTPRVRIPLVGRLVAPILVRLAPSTSVTMLREPPPMLG